MENENYQDWTSCEMYGHAYEADENRPSRRRCTDCGDWYDDDTNEYGESGRIAAKQ